jgi:hypothetical protein
MLRPPAWALPESEFRLVRSGVPVDVDGIKIGAPTGCVVCCDCGRGARNIDWIDHGPNCDSPAADN